MDCTVTHLPYRDTFQFSDLVLDYLSQQPQLKPFFSHSPDIDGIRTAINERQAFPTDRKKITAVFKEQYAGADPSELQQKNIELLLSENSFTICTAHQPNIFTGFLYTIYKTAHIIRIAQDLKKEFPDKNFVPVFYIGSEDNDLDELSQVNINGMKLKWGTKQTGAVGRMIVDKDLIRLKDQINQQMASYPFGKETASILDEAYKEGNTIADATFISLNKLFKTYGLLVLQPDRRDLKELMISIFREDLFRNTSHNLLEKNNAALAEKYKVQVNPREINLFYLKNGERDRIFLKDGKYLTDGGKHSFSPEELETELKNHPENFSPNVVLRGLYQEIILPDIAFVGGGSEIAYWLELKPLFEHFKVPFPALILRNSFVLFNETQKSRIAKLGWEINDLFKPDIDLMNGYVRKHSQKKLTVDEEVADTKKIYKKLSETALEIDITLAQHIAALEHRNIKDLKELEKKMLRAEKRNYEVQQRQLLKLKEELFPKNGLQERVENFIPFYSTYGQKFINAIVDCSTSFQQEFGMICLG